MGSAVPSRVSLLLVSIFGAYLRDSSRVQRRRRRPFFFLPPYAHRVSPEFIGSSNCVPTVHRHRASKPQGSSKRVLPCWQVTMNQLIRASLHTVHKYLTCNIKHEWTLRMYSVIRFQLNWEENEFPLSAVRAEKFRRAKFGRPVCASSARSFS